MDLEKNLLDLQHSLFQTKAALYLSLGIGGGISIFFEGKQLGISSLNSFVTALFFSIPFILYSIEKFEKFKESNFSKKNSEIKISDSFNFKEVEDFAQISSGNRNYAKFSIKNFNKCNKIQEKIYLSIKNRKE